MVLPKSTKSVYPKLYSYYDPPGHPGESFQVLDPETGEYVYEKSLTEQSHKDSCDLNLLLARYARTGELPDMIKSDPQYGDYSELPTYQESLNVVIKAQEQFDALDAPVRKRFENDPAKFLEFATNAANKEEMAELGLLKPDVAKALIDAKAGRSPFKEFPPAGQGTSQATSGAAASPAPSKAPTGGQS